ncbi:hypothetical protein ACS0TY_024443 [Phlomoides rotata]
MLTGPIHECFGELSSLREVSLGSNSLNSTIPSKLWDLSGLLILDLSSNNLSGQVSPRIGTWEVNKLDLSSNPFSGNIPRSIGDYLSMESLWLSNNEFRGSIHTLGNVKGLRTLDLSHNDLSGEITDTLEDLRVLEYFDVSYNRLEGDIPDGISNSTAQSFVHNSGLCGAARFQVPRCRHGRSRSKTIALIFLKYVLPVAAGIVCSWNGVVFPKVKQFTFLDEQELRRTRKVSNLTAFEMLYEYYERCRVLLLIYVYQMECMKVLFIGLHVHPSSIIGSPSAAS